MNKLRRYILCGLFVISLIMSSIIPLSADQHPSRLIDDAGVLSESEESTVLKALDEVSEKYQFEVVIVVTKNVAEKDMQAYADDYYDYNGYGLDSDRSGILFALSLTGDMKNYAISTTGFGMTAFTISGMDYILEQIGDDIRSDQYESAFCEFANYAGIYVEQARNGSAYDDGNYSKQFEDYMAAVLIGLVISLLITLIVMLILKGQLKSVRKQFNANSYVKQGSLQITGSRDMFLYRTMSRTRRETESSSGSGNGSHTSSSGSSHGGTSGHF